MAAYSPLLADAVVFIHCVFVIFVLLGGVAALRWRHIAWFHVPAALWGAVIELGGWVCPLTYLENSLRRMGGGPGYDATFIERYFEPVLYPIGLSRHTQLVFGLGALIINSAIYYRLWKRRLHCRPRVDDRSDDNRPTEEGNIDTRRTRRNG